jgi:hypothetical protein
MLPDLCHICTKRASHSRHDAIASIHDSLDVQSMHVSGVKLKQPTFPPAAGKVHADMRMTRCLAARSAARRGYASAACARHGGPASPPRRRGAARRTARALATFVAREAEPRRVDHGR